MKYIIVLLCFWCSFVFAENKRPATTLPKEVVDWIYDHHACSHFRGEWSDTDEDRIYFLVIKVHKTCFGIKDRKKEILNKYKQGGKFAYPYIISYIFEKFNDKNFDKDNISNNTAFPLEVAEIKSRQKICEQVRDDYIYRVNKTDFDSDYSAAFEYIKLCKNINSIKNDLIKKYKDDAGAVAYLKEINFAPFKYKPKTYEADQADLVE